MSKIVYGFDLVLLKNSFSNTDLLIINKSTAFLRCSVTMERRT